MIRPSSAPNIIYADYQASTPIYNRVADNLCIYFREQLANPHSQDHVLGWQAGKLVEDAAERIGAAIGSDKDEIVFTSGATESNNLALLGLAEANKGNRKRILVSAIEHKSVLAAAAAASNRCGLKVDKLPVTPTGIVRLDKLKELLDEDVLAVSVGLVNGEIGSRQPLSEVVALADAVGAIVHTDAAQALADAPCDVSSLGVGLASFSGHKIYGPQGIGALFVRRDIRSRLAPQIHGGGQQDGLRSGTVPVPLCRALADAVEMAQAPDAKEVRRRIQQCRDRFAARLLAIPGTALNGPALTERHIANCNLRFGGHSAHDLLTRMQSRLAASSGSACASGIPEPSHVLTALGQSPSQAASAIRFSFGRFTTLEEVDAAAEFIAGILVQAAA